MFTRWLCRMGVMVGIGPGAAGAVVPGPPTYSSPAVAPWQLVLVRLQARAAPMPVRRRADGRAD